MNNLKIVVLLLMSMLANAKLIPIGFIRKISPPSLDNTPNVTNVYSNSATLGSILLSSGGSITSIGVKYGTDIYFVTSSTNLITASASPGNYSTIISGLNASTTYHARFFATNSAGTTNGDVISFTTSTPPKAVGDSYGGGKIFYILKSGDAGYDANIQHGLIAATSDQYTGNITWSNNTNYTSAIAQNIRSGFDNTTKIISSQGSGTYAAKIARDYVASGYSDWYLPSYFELKALIAQKTIVGNFNATWYWSSSESNNGYNGSTAPFAWIQQVIATSPNESGKLYNSSTAVRPIRSF